jgi:hypothetical protein
VPASGGNTISFTITFPDMRAAPTANAAWTLATGISNGPFISEGVNWANLSANASVAGNFTGILSAVTLDARL